MLPKNKVLFDTSCYIALLQKEHGYQDIEELQPIAAISAVNLAELVTTLVKKSMSSEAAEVADEMIECIIPFTEKMSFLAGELTVYTKKFGLSLGDRACIATGIIHKMPIYTCDRIWKELDLDCDIRLIR